MEQICKNSLVMHKKTEIDTELEIWRAIFFEFSHLTARIFKNKMNKHILFAFYTQNNDFIFKFRFYFIETRTFSHREFLGIFHLNFCNFVLPIFNLFKAL